MALFGDGDFDILVTPCASCTSTIKKIWPLMDTLEASINQENGQAEAGLRQLAGIVPPALAKAVDDARLAYADLWKITQEVLKLSRENSNINALALTMGVAGKVIEAVKAGKIKHFFLVAGCDGAKPGRNYYTEFVEKAPADTIVLTLACGKFRFFDKKLGDIDGIPRLLDMAELAARLVDSGHAYRTPSGDVYFRVRSFAGYGKLSGRDLEDMFLKSRLLSHPFTPLLHSNIGILIF